MNFDMLKNFEELSRSKSFAKASEKLFISPQGLNKMVFSMEAELGCKLVERTNRGIKLTESGTLFLAYARDLLDEYQSAMDSVASVDSDRTRLREASFSVATTALCIERILEPMMKDDLIGDIKIRETSPDEAIKLSKEDGWLALIDIPVSSEHATKDDDRSMIEIALTKLGIIYNKKTFGDLGNHISVKELSKMPLGVIEAPTMLSYAESFIGKDILGNQTRIMTRQYGVLYEAASSGRVAMLYDSFSWSQLGTGTIRTRPHVDFCQIEDHCLKIGFAHYKDAKDAEKRAYIDSFHNVLRLAATKNGWSLD